ncbi:MAG: hypothetical protein ACLRV7_06670 [Hoylesella buccalis]
MQTEERQNIFTEEYNKYEVRKDEHKNSNESIGKEVKVYEKEVYKSKGGYH